MSALEEDAEAVHVSLRGQVVDDGLLGGGPVSNQIQAHLQILRGIEKHRTP
jgi:hypothetical protein